MLSTYITVLLALMSAYVLHKYLFPARISQDSFDDSYHYVIVGGGSAGSVVASRLSENPNVRVLLLEAGDDDANYPDIRVPMKAFTLWGNDEVGWLYKTVPQKQACLSMKNHQCAWPKGKVLGGGSSINGMIYLRGHPNDYNSWARDGCDGWDYNSILPYFIKSENNENDLIASSEFHGTAGPHVVSDSNKTTTGTVLLDAFMTGGSEMGYVHGDLNGHETIRTVMHNQVNVKDGERHSVADAFLRPVASSRPNLHILTKAHATKVTFNGTTATGVEFLHDNKKHHVTSKREVVLAAGPIASPQLLMLSGVGPRAHLESLQIPVVADLPVGENLHDHMLLSVLQFTLKEPVAFVPSEMESFWEIFKYKLFRKGVHASPITLYAHAFERSMFQPVEHDVPYIKLIMFGQLTGTSEEGLREYANTMNQDFELQMKQFGGCTNQHGFQLFPVLLHPKSKGSILLNSTNPFDHPLIDPAYLSHPDDVKVLVDGVRMAQKLGATSTFKELGAEFRELVHPSCTQMKYDSDYYWECVVRHMALTEFHPVGTCRMGALDDARTVVDSRLRVKHVDNLRIIDSSIIPEIISGNTNAPTVMIAEKGADMIKQDYLWRGLK